MDPEQEGAENDMARRGYLGPEPTLDFQPIDDLSALGSLKSPHHARLGMEMLSLPPPPLFRADKLPDRVIAEHSPRLHVAGAEFYALTDHELGGYGLLERDGRVFVDPNVQPVGYNSMIKEGEIPSHWTAGLFQTETETIDCGSVVGVALNAHLVWGHFLLEMLSRLHLLNQLKQFGVPTRVAVPIDGPKWVREFVGLYFSPEEMILYEAGRHRLRADCFILPSMMMQQYCFHPAMNLVVEDLLDWVIQSPTRSSGKRLYLSRSRHFGEHIIENEAEVESVLLDLDFIVVHPQELSIREQLSLYSQARCIVSQYSSVSHNAMFAPRGTPVLCLGWMNRCQSGIAALRGQPIGYVKPSNCDLIFPPEGRPPCQFRMHIDCRDLVDVVDAFLRWAS